MSYPTVRRSLLTGLMAMVAVGIATLVSSSCAPPPLTEASDAGGGLVDGGDGTSQNVRFERVADLMRNNCANAGCHGNNGMGAFAIEGGAAATDQQVREALEGTTAEGERTLLVEPGDPAKSALFQALTGMNSRTRMPPGSQNFGPRRVETIRRWIAQGASYE